MACPGSGPSRASEPLCKRLTAMAESGDRHSRTCHDRLQDPDRQPRRDRRAHRARRRRARPEKRRDLFRRRCRQRACEGRRCGACAGRERACGLSRHCPRRCRREERGLRRDPSRLWLPERKRAVRRGLREGGNHLHRPEPARAFDLRRQSAGARPGVEVRRAGAGGNGGTGHARAGAGVLPHARRNHHQGHRRRRWARDAHRHE